MKNGNWLTRYRLRTVIAALSTATSHGLRPGVKGFAEALEATALMSQSGKKDAPVTIQCTRRELNEFVSYMTQLHVAKQSLLIRARIGLAVLCMSNKQILGEDPEELIAREKGAVKSSSDDKVIQLTTKR
jgi:hypothetical protein